MSTQYKLIITNIQRFSLHDGPGIRTTFFFKGCSLKCPWCSNPENINMYPETYILNGKYGTYGKYFTNDELFDELIKDRIYYDKNGGITFSGGEPLLQFDKIEPLLKKLKDEKINTCIETSLFANFDLFEVASRYIDLFYVDLKILTSQRCYDVLGGNLDIYMQNLASLHLLDIPKIYRVPMISGYNMDDENIMNIVNTIEKFPPLKVELLYQHNLGDSKYVSLNRKKPMKYNLDKDIVQVLISELNRLKIPVEIFQI